MTADAENGAVAEIDEGRSDTGFAQQHADLLQRIALGEATEIERRFLPVEADADDTRLRAETNAGEVPEGDVEKPLGPFAIRPARLQRFAKFGPDLYGSACGRGIHPCDLARGIEAVEQVFIYKNGRQYFAFDL